MPAQALCVGSHLLGSGWYCHMSSYHFLHPYVRACCRYESTLEFCAGCNATQTKLNAWGWADSRCDLNFTAICRMATKGPCSLPPYTDKTTGASYLYNSDEMVQADAEQWCNGQGGHLVSYESLAEQKNVEGYFMDGGEGAVAWLCCWLSGLATA